MLSPDFPLSAAEKLLARAQLPGTAKWSPLTGGANNRVWKGVTAARTVLLKIYYHDSRDSRDRFRGEYTFYTLANRCALPSVPDVLGWDASARLGLFAFVDGRKLSPTEITSEQISEAGHLVARLNDSLHPPLPLDPPIASEACFSVQAHLSTVEKRLTRLSNLTPADDIDHKAVSWVRDELWPLWLHLKHTTTSRLEPEDFKRQLPLDQRWLSPSDFGFHNALQTSEHKLIFFDFEYAGWDDPAKLIADFFCQPAVPVSLDHWDTLLATLSSCHRWAETIPSRAALLLPTYCLKWCCIILNEFLKTESARRAFSRGSSREDRRSSQLEKAQYFLNARHHLLHF